MKRKYEQRKKVNCFYCEKVLELYYLPERKRYSVKYCLYNFTGKEELKDKHSCYKCILEQAYKIPKPPLKNLILNKKVKFFANKKTRKRFLTYRFLGIYKKDEGNELTQKKISIFGN